MSNALALVPALEQLYLQLGITDVISEAELHAALSQFETKLLAIAVDMHGAESRGVPLRCAVHDEINFPHLHRAHATIGDLLNMDVPAPLERWMRQVASTPPPVLAEQIQTRLAHEAGGALSPSSCAARFVLFECARAFLKLAAFRTDGAFEAVGASDEEIEEIAEENTDALIAMVPALPADIRPVHVLIASAMFELTETVEELRVSLRALGQDIALRLAEQAQIVRNLRDVEAVDAALIQNALAPSMGEQRVSLEQLQRKHPLLLGRRSRDALDQRASRLRKRLRQRVGRLPRRARPSLYQVIAKIGEE